MAEFGDIKAKYFPMVIPDEAEVVRREKSKLNKLATNVIGRVDAIRGAKHDHFCTFPLNIPSDIRPETVAKFMAEVECFLSSDPDFCHELKTYQSFGGVDHTVISFWRKLPNARS